MPAMTGLRELSTHLLSGAIPIERAYPMAPRLQAEPIELAHQAAPDDDAIRAARDLRDGSGRVAEVDVVCAPETSLALLDGFSWRRGQVTPVPR